MGKIFNLQKELLKTEEDHDEIVGENYKDKNDGWLYYVKQEVSCLLLSIMLGIVNQ